jgi:hypothetical protein
MAYRADHAAHDPRIVQGAARGASEVAKHRDGLVAMDLPVVLFSKVGLFDRSRAPAPDSFVTTSQIKDFDRKLESTPGFLWMVTEGNDRVAQVNSGRAYARVQLAATAHELAMQPLQQALQEYPEQAGPHARHPAPARSAGAGDDRADVGARGLRTSGRARTAPRAGRVRGTRLTPASCGQPAGN